MKKTVKLLSLFIVICMLLSSCAQSVGEVANTIIDSKTNNSVVENVVSNTGSTETANAEQLSVSNKNEAIPEKGTYNEGVALVKYDGEMNDNVLSQLNLVSATALYNGSTWYTVELAADADTVETVIYLRELDCFEKVDYDYIMGVTAEVESVDISGNPAHGKQNDTFKTHHIKEGWDYLKKNGMNPGGSSDVIVAVIDTGVDYTHLDLRNNIWVNSAEIPDNGKDDDGNGYIDDLCGWDCVGNDKDPMDDNGHGTHVAGIIAAENNKEGGVGVAYNCKVMVLKAGNSSGYFNNSDIAEAVQYAYMNGASVINMSFGGSNISVAVEEALENAYNTSVLVAAAGNDTLCNNGCDKHDSNFGSYPAALPYVIGVMSTDASGKHLSPFSNYDHFPYNALEYEVYAVGEGVYSTWPGNKYATLNGTSMAAPMVSGIAALLRTYYSDREMYSTKYIQSQIVSTGTIHPFNRVLEETDNGHAVADVYEALSRIPKPSVTLYDYTFSDSVDIHPANNGNGVIDAGETVRLSIALHNRGGVATEVNVSIDTIRNGDTNLTDPYFTISKSMISLSDIGTYSVRECYEDQYFEIIVSSDCPNGYINDFNFHFTYKNGLDDNDHTVYTDNEKVKISFVVQNGVYLPVVIDEDTVLKANRLYLVKNDILVREDITLTIEPGAIIQKAETNNTHTINVAGTLLCHAVPDNLIDIIGLNVRRKNTGYLSFSYTNLECGDVDADIIDHCHVYGTVTATYATNSIFESYVPKGNIENCKIHLNLYTSNDVISYKEVLTKGHYKNCVFITGLNGHNSISLSIGSGTYVFTPYTRTAITMDSIDKIIETDNKSYIVINSQFSSSSPDRELVKLEGEILASCFGGKIATLSKTEQTALNISGLCYTPDNNFEGNVNKIIFEVDRTNVTEVEIEAAYIEYCNNTIGLPSFENVAILSENLNIETSSNLEDPDEKYRWDLSNIYLGTNDIHAIEKMIGGYETYGKYKCVLPKNYIELPNENMWPMVTDAYILNENGERVSTIGTNNVQFVVEFNRDMDTTIPLKVTFGTIEPYADYKIDGEWVSSRKWIANYTLKSNIENGNQYLMISNAQAVEDAFLTAVDQTGRFQFTIDTTAAMSMNLQAIAKDNGIELTFAQDDYDTLLGYNIYRADSKDGNYVKLNPAILLPSDKSFVDENAEPGKTYWYTYTVVLTDFSESNPAGKVVATAMDTLAPNMYHTPVNQGYMNNNLVISCTATDNMAIASVTLYYRTVGATEWKTLNMSKQSDKYSATVFGSDLTLDGIEYYIVASDGRNTINKGSAETPYTVIVKDASAISRKGDVDGDGVVTTKDALMLMQCINGDLILTDDEFKRADLNGDNVLNSSEALRILQYINGNVSTLDM